jgi:hypothetical protein
MKINCKKSYIFSNLICVPEIKIRSDFRRQWFVVVVPDEGDVVGKGVDVATEVKAGVVVNISFWLQLFEIGTLKIAFRKILI